MERKHNKIILSLLLLASLCWRAIPVGAQQSDQFTSSVQAAAARTDGQILKSLQTQARGPEYAALLGRIFGNEADAAAAVAVFDAESEQLLQAVSAAGGRKAHERLQQQIRESKEKSAGQITATPKTIAPSKTKVPTKPVPPSRKISSSGLPRLDWRQLAFGFQPIAQQPEIKFTETDKEIIATGQDKKSFETKDARGTRTQSAESRHIKDGAVFGVEIKNTQIIEAVSKTDGKSFRTEVSMMWGAEVAACPDVDGIAKGTAKANVSSKTVLTEGGQTSTITTDLDIQAKLTGYVNDEAELKGYDLQADAYVTNSGQEEALRRNLVKELKLKDGRHGMHVEMAGNTIEISDGTYRGERTPAKAGAALTRNLTEMTRADAATVGSSIGPLVAAAWVQANEMYASAQKNWKGGGCVEVITQAPKSELKTGERVAVAVETVHLRDKSKVNARLDAEGGPGTLTPESQRGTPAATFTFTKDGEEGSYVTVKSTSKRGIGESTLQFGKELDEPSETGAWTGSIDVRRSRYEEKEKRSGSNLAENGGYLETITYVKFKLSGRLDRTVDATNANIARVTGNQTHIDHEYDRYKVDEGYCGPNAVPYKGEKEITRTSTTKTQYDKDTRVYVDVGGTEGTITFSLPDVPGRTVHAYVHTSPCADHDRANTNQAVDEEAASVGGSFVFTFPFDRSQKVVRGTITVPESDGGKTEYTWELRRK